MVRHKRKRVDLGHHDIPTKANRILNVILLAMGLIALRIWYLTIIQYDVKLDESRKPQRKVVIEPATRATIRDRFNLPLAINKIQYQAAILYSQLREIPSFKWEVDSSGKKVKRFLRKEYIHNLATLLARELNIEVERIEDQIYAKASFYAQVPFVIKPEISENEYYRLRMLEKDWPGIYVRRLPQRTYPRGRVACDVIGYMGAINRQEYEKILQEIKSLEQCIVDAEAEVEDIEFPPGILTAAQARHRLTDLEEKAYTIHDYIGKAGIEGFFEQQLRGFYGKKIFYSNAQGHYLRELSGARVPMSGQRMLLTISAELQEYAEQLLTQNEAFRPVRVSNTGAAKQTMLSQKHPWIKGGAIVVMDPKTGDFLTLASYPRFNPNDFIASGDKDLNKEKNGRINQWFENDAYIASMWDQQRPLEREKFKDEENQFYEEKRKLSWSAYLNLILPPEGDLFHAMQQLANVQQAVELQQQVDRLKELAENPSLYAIFNALYKGDEHLAYKPIGETVEDQTLEKRLNGSVEVKAVKKKLDPYFHSLPQNYDKVLLIDLCRLAVPHDRYSPSLLNYVGHHSLDAYREATSSFVTVMSTVKEMTKEVFHDTAFKSWRKEKEKEFLKEKRAQEKAAKSYPKPYIDYLEQHENTAFQVFWDRYKWDLLLTFLSGKNSSLHNEAITPYVNYLNNWHRELSFGAHQAVSWRPAYMQLQQLITPLPQNISIAYLKTMRSYQELDRPLFGRYRYLRSKHAPLEKHLAGAFYPVYGFGYGRSHAYRQATIQGSIFKMVLAYEALIQRFHTLENPTRQSLNPLVIIDQVHQQGQTRYVGYTKDNVPIPQLYKGGRLPRSLAHQNIGEVGLIRALALSSNPYFSLLAGECLEHPEDLTDAARMFSYGSRTGIELPGEISGKIPTDVAENRTGLYALAIGQHSLVVTPLQTAVMLCAIANGGQVMKPKIVLLTAGKEPTREGEIHTDSQENQKSLVKLTPSVMKREVFLPSLVRSILLDGLAACLQKLYQEGGGGSLAKLYEKHPEALNACHELRSEMVGKTSTSESVEHLDMDIKDGSNLYMHVWFGSISFEKKGMQQNTVIVRDEWGNPELVVVVYLRFGGFGKEAAPLAAQMVKKWREIKQKY